MTSCERDQTSNVDVLAGCALWRLYGAEAAPVRVAGDGRLSLRLLERPAATDFEQQQQQPQTHSAGLVAAPSGELVAQLRLNGAELQLSNELPVLVLADLNLFVLSSRVAHAAAEASPRGVDLNADDSSRQGTTTTTTLFYYLVVPQPLENGLTLVQALRQVAFVYELKPLADDVSSSAHAAGSSIESAGASFSRGLIGFATSVNKAIDSGTKRYVKHQQAKASQRQHSAGDVSSAAANSDHSRSTSPPPPPALPARNSLTSLDDAQQRPRADSSPAAPSSARPTSSAHATARSFFHGTNKTSHAFSHAFESVGRTGAEAVHVDLQRRQTKKAAASSGAADAPPHSLNEADGAPPPPPPLPTRPSASSLDASSAPPLPARPASASSLQLPRSRSSTELQSNSSSWLEPPPPLPPRSASPSPSPSAPPLPARAASMSTLGQSGGRKAPSASSSSSSNSSSNKKPPSTVDSIVVVGTSLANFGRLAWSGTKQSVRSVSSQIKTSHVEKERALRGDAAAERSRERWRTAGYVTLGTLQTVGMIQTLVKLPLHAAVDVAIGALGYDPCLKSAIDGQSLKCGWLMRERGMMLPWTRCVAALRPIGFVLYDGGPPPSQHHKPGLVVKLEDIVAVRLAPQKVAPHCFCIETRGKFFFFSPGLAALGGLPAPNQPPLEDWHGEGDLQRETASWLNAIEAVSRPSRLHERKRLRAAQASASFWSGLASSSTLL